MSQSLAALYTHIVFSTKHRVPFLLDRTIRHQVFANLTAVSEKLNCPPLCVGGATDHAHLLVRLGRVISISECVKELKRASSVSSKQLSPSLRDFGWQSGYGAFSVGRSEIEVVRRYIGNQEEHHKVITFKEEYIRLLEENGIDWAERYVWD